MTSRAASRAITGPGWNVLWRRSRARLRSRCAGTGPTRMQVQTPSPRPRCCNPLFSGAFRRRQRSGELRLVALSGANRARPAEVAVATAAPRPKVLPSQFRTARTPTRNRLQDSSVPPSGVATALQTRIYTSCNIATVGRDDTRLVVYLNRAICNDASRVRLNTDVAWTLPSCSVGILVARRLLALVRLRIC